MFKDNKEQAETFFSISVDDELIPWSEVLGSMQLFGTLKPFLKEFVGQYVLIREIKKRDDCEVAPGDVMQAILDFRIRSNLNDREEFERWLRSENLDLVTFEKRIHFELQLKKLKQLIAGPNVPDYFEKNRAALEDNLLTCLLIEDRATADKLMELISAGENDFTQLATRFKDDENFSPVNCLTQKVSRRSLTQDFRAQVGIDPVGVIYGPLKYRDGWMIFRVEKVIPAKLDQKLFSQLENQVFKQWLLEQVKGVKLGFKANPSFGQEEIDT